MAHKFEIYKDKAGEFRVRFKYNSEVMFSTEGNSVEVRGQGRHREHQEERPRRRGRRRGLNPLNPSPLGGGVAAGHGGGPPQAF